MREVFLGVATVALLRIGESLPNEKKERVWDNGREVKRGMKKIPTLFVREFDERGNIRRVTEEVTAGMEWVLEGKGEATEKVDGAACAIIGGEFYQRFDAKEGRRVPTGAIPCQPTRDPYTGHWPHWAKVTNPAGSGKWFMHAWANTPWCFEDGTYEAVGPHFQSNPYGLDADFLERHGRIKIRDCPRTYDGIREWLRVHEVEGIVFWLDGEPRCKIKRSDFGFPWPIKGER